VDLTVDAVDARCWRKPAQADVRVTVAPPPPPDAKLTTGVGDVTLKLPPGSTGSFTLDTGVGSVGVTDSTESR